MSIHKNIIGELALFDPVFLADMDRAALMNRVDTKFIFKSALLPAILKELPSHYLILEINGVRMHTYSSLYYDTPEYHLYYQHFRGMFSRYKVRLRKYLETGLSFFEVKFKNNKGRTIKSRVSIDSEHAPGGEGGQLVNEITPFKFDQLDPKFWVEYKRLTFVSKDFTERVTIDTGLTYRDGKREQVNDHIVIAELKQAKIGKSFFRDVMKKYSVRQQSLSKYCFGVVSMNDEVKKNKFKEQELNINKLKYGSSSKR